MRLPVALALLSCGSNETPRSPPDARTEEAPPPAPHDGGTSAPAPAVPPPTRPFSAGDVIPEGFAHEPAGAAGHSAFADGVPIPWRCEVIGRTRTTLAARCDVPSGQARSFYQRLHRAFGRDMFGGVWNEEEQFAYYDRPIEKGMRIHISADRDRALYGAATNGAALRVQHEPAGDFTADPPPAHDASAEDLYLRSFGQWRCGARDVFLGVRRIVIGNARTDAVCGAIQLDAAGPRRVRIRCTEVTGDHEEVLGSGAAERYRRQGVTLEVGAGAASVGFDGTPCRRTNRAR